MDTFNKAVSVIYRCEARHIIFFPFTEFSCISSPFLAIYLQNIVPAFVCLCNLYPSHFIHRVTVPVLEPVVEVSVSDVSVEVSVRSTELEAEPSTLMLADLATGLAK
jgi:hypothetical protein